MKLYAGKIKQLRKRLKYGNTIVKVDGKTFRSKKEAEFYQKIKLLFDKGEVTDYALQVPFHIPPAQKEHKKYYLDFEVTYKDGSVHYYDVKGFKTELYKLKKLMVEFFYKIKIEEV